LPLVEHVYENLFAISFLYGFPFIRWDNIEQCLEITPGNSYAFQALGFLFGGGVSFGNFERSAVANTWSLLWNYILYMDD
jgi:hypothetical protein